MPATAQFICVRMKTKPGERKGRAREEEKEKKRKQIKRTTTGQTKENNAMTRTTTGRNKETERSEERSRAERRRGKQTLMLPRRPQMLRQLQTSPFSRSPLVWLAPPSEAARRATRERRNTTVVPTYEPRCRISSCLQLFVFSFSSCCSFSTRRRRRRWLSPSVRAAPDAAPAAWGWHGPPTRHEFSKRLSRTLLD